MSGRELNKTIFKQIPEEDSESLLFDFERIGKDGRFHYWDNQEDHCNNYTFLGKVLYPEGSKLTKEQKSMYRCHFLFAYRGELVKYCFCNSHYSINNHNYHHSWVNLDDFIPSISDVSEAEYWDEDEKGDQYLSSRAEWLTIKTPQIFLRA